MDDPDAVGWDEAYGWWTLNKNARSVNFLFGNFPTRKDDECQLEMGAGLGCVVGID